MLARSNIALVARRQMPPTGPCTYFWITNTIALDGLIRSDNRGSESIFPLWLDGESAAGQANLAPHFVAETAIQLGLTWDEFGTSKAENRFGPADVLHYIYGLFTAPTYRRRYSDSLRRDFPRVLIPQCRTIWTAFRDIGEPGETVRRNVGYPKFALDQIWLGHEGPVVPASQRVWNFHAGTHQVCRKWLRDRRAIGATTLSGYEQIVAAITETVELTDRLDATVAAAGGWDAVFSA